MSSLLLGYDHVVGTAGEGVERGGLVVERRWPEWCAVDTGAVLIVLYLTSVRTPWIPDMTAIVRAAAERRSDGRVATMSVLRLDKRYPIDIGFDSNLVHVREAIRELAPSLRASSFVLDVDGFLWTTMRKALGLLGRAAPFPNAVHDNVVSAARWLAPYAALDVADAVRTCTLAVDLMKRHLGCAE